MYLFGSICFFTLQKIVGFKEKKKNPWFLKFHNDTYVLLYIFSHTGAQHSIGLFQSGYLWTSMEFSSVISLKVSSLPLFLSFLSRISTSQTTLSLWINSLIVFYHLFSISLLFLPIFREFSFNFPFSSPFFILAPIFSKTYGGFGGRIGPWEMHLGLPAGIGQRLRDGALFLGVD